MRYLKEILYLIGSDKKKLPWMILLFLMVSLLDAIGIGLLGPYVSLIVDPSIAEEGILKVFFDLLSGFSSTQNGLLILMSVVLVFLFFVKSVAGILILKLIINFAYKQQVRIRGDLMKSYQSMKYVEYIRRNSSEYIFSIQELSAKFTGKIMMVGLRTISDILLTISIIIVLAWTDIKLVGVLLFLIAIVGLIFDRLIRKSVQIFGKNANIASTEMVKAVSEGITGMKEIRILGKAEYFYKIVFNEATNFADNAKKSDLRTNVPKYLFEFMVILFLTSMVIVELLVNGEMIKLIPTLAVFGLASMKLVPAISSISNGIIQLRFYRNTVSLLHKDMQKIEKLNKANEINKSNELFNTLSLDAIKYKYPESKKSVLHGITMTINKGESIGIIGPSGSGKTTLVDIILGLLEPNEGDIKLNGRRINESMVDLQNKVAYLPQQVFILDDTLKNNIILGEPISSETNDRLNKAIKQSQLKELLDTLPKGLDTRLGEHGISFSGGQRQRVALARAIFHQKEILVMDEATSALDEATEKEVVDEIKRLKGVSTMIIIAHRLDTLKYCDQIYRIEDGKIVEINTYEELTKKRKS
jgi:ABC-type multidrug transport system fused ATPase/permease subunit